MICHPDFVPVASLVFGAERRDAVGRLWKAQQGYAKSIGDDDFHLQVSLDSMTPSEHFEFDVFHSIGDRSFLSGPDGQVRSFGQAYLRGMLHEARLTWHASYLRDRLVKRKKGVGLPPDFMRRHRIPGYSTEIASRATEKGVPLAHEAWVSGYISGYTRPSLFFSRHSYTICLDALPFVIEAVGDQEDWQIEVEMELLRPLSGWVWCTDRAFVESGQWRETINSTVEQSCSHLTRFQADASITRIGRPPNVRDDTLAAYKRLYPDGHGRLSWPRVLAKVNAQTGHHCSVDTLKRAVGSSNIERKIEAK